MLNNAKKFVVVLAALAFIAAAGVATATQSAPGALSPKVAALKYEDVKRLLPDRIGELTADTWGEIAPVTVAGVEYQLPFIVQPDAVYTWHHMRKYLPKEVADKPTSGTPNDEQIFFYVTKLAEAADKNAGLLIRKDFDAHKAKYTLLYPNAKGEDAVFAEVYDRYVTDENGKTAPDAQKAYNEFVALSMLSSALASYIQLKEKL